MYAANIEAVMLKLGLCCTDVGLTMFDLLLRGNYTSGEEGEWEYLKYLQVGKGGIFCNHLESTELNRNM